MDNQEKKIEDQDYIDVLKKAQEELPGVVLPSMGLIQNDVMIQIDGKKVIGKNEIKE